MTDTTPLRLYEEITLLALRDRTGAITNSYALYAVAAAVMAELLLEGRITVEDSRKQFVDLASAEPVGDPILDWWLGRIQEAKRRASLTDWVNRLGGISGLRDKAALRLCQRKIVRAKEETVLLLFKRKLYPEVNPVPEKRIIERLRAAIFTDDAPLDPRTVVLVSLANSCQLLDQAFGGKEVKSRKKRIEQIAGGELTGKATKKVIEACEAAVMVAAMMPVFMASTSAFNHSG